MAVAAGGEPQRNFDVVSFGLPAATSSLWLCGFFPREWLSWKLHPGEEAGFRSPPTLGGGMAAAIIVKKRENTVYKL